MRIRVFLPIGNEPWWMNQWRWGQYMKTGVWPIGLPEGLIQVDITKTINLIS